MSIFDDVARIMDLKQVASDIKELKENDKPAKKEYKTVPEGEYTVSIRDMFLESYNTQYGPNVKLKVQFKILEGEFEKSVMFWDQTLFTSKNYGLRVVNDFLTSLDSGYVIEFDTAEQYEQLIPDVLLQVKDNIYKVDFHLNGKYKEYKILEKLDSLPF